MTINLLSSASVSGQENPKGFVEVIAIKGSVIFNDTKLKKGDKIQFKPGVGPFDQLKFSNNTDWIRLMEVKTNKVYQYYYQKKYSCSNCLFTRELSIYSDTKDHFIDFFKRNPIFLFEEDTIILKYGSQKTGDNYFAAFQVVLNGKKYMRNVGEPDSINISYQSLFGFSEMKKITCPSFKTDSIGLIFYNKNTKKEINHGLPYFHIIFFNDAVKFLKEMGLNSEEIYNELTDNYIDLKYLAKDRDFDDTETAKRWLKKEIVDFGSR